MSNQNSPPDTPSIRSRGIKSTSRDLAHATFETAKVPAEPSGQDKDAEKPHARPSHAELDRPEVARAGRCQLYDWRPRGRSR